MGFDREATQYNCGCYYEYFSHDFFNYSKDHQFHNVCGKHNTHKFAMEEQHKEQQGKQIIEQASYVLSQKMKPDKVIHFLRIKNVLSKKEENNLLEITSERQRAKELLSVLANSTKPSYQQLRIALIKANQSDLLKYLNEGSTTEEEGDITTAYEGKCFLHLQGDTHVVAKEYKNQMYIHIRNYDHTGPRHFPTKQGVALTPSRWLLLEMKKGNIREQYQKSIEGKLEDEVVMHLGGGVYVTINPKFPTIDIRHFWKPQDSDKPVATKREIVLTKTKWERLCLVMEMIRDFIPELDKACIC
ncbi:uncharacterized protein LOC127721642 [Mytilus californianus]|uniref:uncharacterized protein LOC127721642 n=1 Tax=Mytilus californianus TaxID=6549 RepID=UPI0022465F25|nr:uncharacterized protein LOC127721642 [Mytilus californianus]